MPRKVEPILSLPLSCSLAASSNRWVGRIRCAFREISNRRIHIHTVLFNLSDFALKRHRIDDHTVANQIQFAITENTAWNGVEHMLPSIKFERMTGIRPTLETAQ